jgi:hypothetical protein
MDIWISLAFTLAVVLTIIGIVYTIRNWGGEE